MTSFAEDDTLLDLLVEALPHLRGGLSFQSADFTARLLHRHLRLDASAIVSHDAVLAFVGVGADHHIVGKPSITQLTADALRTGKIVRTHDRATIGCPQGDCPFSSAVVAPLIVRDSVVGAIKLYHSPGRVIIDRDEKVAGGLARLFSVYLELAELGARAALVTRAELEALRAQISPHFLFNTLTTIAGLTRTDSDRAHDLIVDFAEFFRDTLSSRSELVRFSEELRYVERYLRFEQARFGNRLNVEYEIEADVLDVFVPVLSIQPLVENAVVHGVAPNGRGCVRIRAATRGRGFEFAVLDDGVGIPESQRERILERGYGSGLGVGLNNVHHRLTGLFGPASGLHIESRSGAGTKVWFWLPPEIAVDLQR